MSACVFYIYERLNNNYVNRDDLYQLILLRDEGSSLRSAGCGPGQTEHADLPYAVLGGGFAATDAQASVRPTQGLAGAVVGGADDPGVRPG